MRILIDADLPRPVADLVRRHGHEAVDVRDIGRGSAEDEEIAALAQTEGFCLLSGDFGFADIRRYPPSQYHGLVVLGLPKRFTRDYILRLIESFLDQPEILARVPGRLAIVEAGRIRLRSG